MHIGGNLQWRGGRNETLTEKVFVTAVESWELGGCSSDPGGGDESRGDNSYLSSALLSPTFDWASKEMKGCSPPTLKAQHYCLCA